MSDRFRVQHPESLLPFLNTQLKGWTRNNIKKRLKTGCVTVNDVPIMQHDHALSVGDNIEVRAAGKPMVRETARLEILYSDPDIVVINKPTGLLSVASDDEKKQHALALLRQQLSRPKQPVKLWTVYRLDRETSGVLVFVTSRKMREAINENWGHAEKTYLAIVDGSPNPSQGRIDQPLRTDHENQQVIVGPHEDAKKAVTHFKTLRTVNGRSLVEIRLETGRHHQILAHMAWLGHPIVGDGNYGTYGPRTGLHAVSLTITRPETGKRLTFETPMPANMMDLLQ